MLQKFLIPKMHPHTEFQNFYRQHKDTNRKPSHQQPIQTRNIPESHPNRGEAIGRTGRPLHEKLPSIVLHQSGVHHEPYRNPKRFLQRTSLWDHNLKRPCGIGFNFLKLTLLVIAERFWKLTCLIWFYVVCKSEPTHNPGVDVGSVTVKRMLSSFDKINSQAYVYESNITVKNFLLVQLTSKWIFCSLKLFMKISFCIT